MRRERAIRKLLLSVPITLIGLVLAASTVLAQTQVEKISAPSLTGSASIITPSGTSAFKIPPTGSLKATILRTGAMKGKINALTVDFSTGLTPPPTALRANFPSSDALRFQFGGFVDWETVLDGNVKPAGGNAIRAIGNLTVFKFGASQFVFISIRFFWPAEGGVCTVSMFGPVTGTIP